MHIDHTVPVSAVLVKGFWYNVAGAFRLDGEAYCDSTSRYCDVYRFDYRHGGDTVTMRVLADLVGGVQFEGAA